MTKLKFKLDNNDRFFIDNNYITNGHWLILRKTPNKIMPKTFAVFDGFTPGTYYGTKSSDAVMAEIPNIELVIPKDRENYQPAKLTAVASFDPKACIIKAIKIEGETKHAWINSIYAPLIADSEILIKNAVSPILVNRGGELAAVVMPIRE